MLRQKRLYILLVAVLILCALSFTAYAYPVPDLSQKGSIKITMHYGDKAVSGGSMTLYRVGAVGEQDGNYNFVPAGDFVDCGISLTDIQSASLARELANYAAAERLQGKAQDIDKEGIVIFTELEPGLYLLVQNKAASGYRKASPFLVSVPMLEEETYIYDVEAGPKAELTPVPPDSGDEPDNPDDPDDPDKPTKPAPTEPEPGPGYEPSKDPNNNPGGGGGHEGDPSQGGTDGPGGDRSSGEHSSGGTNGTDGTEGTKEPEEKLPQTGQLNWPVPVLTVLGLGMVSLGWKLRYGTKEDDET